MTSTAKQDATTRQQIANKLMWMANELTDELTAERPPFYRCPSCGNEGFEDELHEFHVGVPAKKECFYYQLGIEDGRAGGSERIAGV